MTKWRFILFAGLWLAAEVPAAERPLIPDPNYLPIARRFAKQFPEEHLKRLPLDESVSARTWTNYLASLDPERVYFLQSDIDAFRTDETKLSDKLKARFPRTLANLKAAIRKLPHVLVFDNTDLNRPFRYVAEFEDGRCVEPFDPPRWLRGLEPKVR